MQVPRLVTGRGKELGLSEAVRRGDTEVGSYHSAPVRLASVSVEITGHVGELASVRLALVSVECHSVALVRFAVQFALVSVAEFSFAMVRLAPAHWRWSVSRNPDTRC